MHRKLRVALVAVVVVLLGALLVQQGLGAPLPTPSIAADAQVGPSAAGPVDRSGVGGTDDGGRNDDGGRKDRDDSVAQVNPEPQELDDDGGLDDTDDDGGDD